MAIGLYTSFTGYVILGQIVILHLLYVILTEILLVHFLLDFWICFYWVQRTLLIYGMGGFGFFLDALRFSKAVTTALLLGLVTVCDHLRPIVVLWVIMRALLILILVNYLVSNRQPLIAHVINRR